MTKVGGDGQMIEAEIEAASLAGAPTVQLPATQRTTTGTNASRNSPTDP